MNMKEAKQLKHGDLVTTKGSLAGMVLEVDYIYYKECKLAYGRTITARCPTVVVKQPGYDLGWRTELQYSRVHKFEG